jgi:DNA-binding SARP family transcriptional activator
MFQTRVLEARRALAAGLPSPAAELARSALELWRGPALVDVAFADFAQPEIRHLEELQLSAIETRIAADLTVGRHADLVSELYALTLMHPTRERFAWQLMLALYRSGRQAEALESYERVRIQLGRELGLEPGPALKDLQGKILDQDPSLGHAPQTPSPAQSPAAGNQPTSTIDFEIRACKVSMSVTRPGAGLVVSARRATPTATADLTRALDQVRITRWLRVE